jgi:hypothetical protein
MKQWFHVEDGEQRGPFSEGGMADLYRAGRIDGTTYVWRDGMADWRPLAETELAGIAAGGEPAEDRPAAGLPPRPASVTAFGIMNIVFGGSALLCLPIAVPLAFVGFATGEFPLGYRIAAVVAQVAAIPLAVLELSTGIGLLMRKGWARKGAIVFGVGSIASAIFGAFLNLWLLASDSIRQTEVLAGTVGGIAGAVIGMIYPILLIYFMRRPPAVECCSE